MPELSIFCAVMHWYIMTMQLVHFLIFKSTKHCFYNIKVSELAVSNPKKWGKQVKSLTGQDKSPKQEWYYQFLSDTTPANSNLATEINNFFVNITEHFEPLTSVETPPPPPLPPNVVPSHLFVALEEELSDVRKLAINKAMSPDRISNKLLKEFAPIICHIYNQSMRKGFVSDPLKQPIVTLVPPDPPPLRILHQTWGLSH